MEYIVMIVLCFCIIAMILVSNYLIENDYKFELFVIHGCYILGEDKITIGSLIVNIVGLIFITGLLVDAYIGGTLYEVRNWQNCNVLWCK